MNEPTDKDREAARAIKIGICACSGRPPYVCIEHEAIATALTNATARGRDEAKAEAAEIARSMISQDTDWDTSYWNQACERIEFRILASASGPSLEERLRAEIAEAVARLSTIRTGFAEDTTKYVSRDDVLAIIEGSEK